MTNEEAKKLLEADGYVVLRAKSYRQAPEPDPSDVVLRSGYPWRLTERSKPNE